LAPESSRVLATAERRFLPQMGTDETQMGTVRLGGWVLRFQTKPEQRAHCKAETKNHHGGFLMVQTDISFVPVS
jgi:hypothetical protein